MTATPFARAAASSFFTFGIEATQRGRRSALQVCLLKSSSRSAVVLGSTAACFTAGAAGACTDDQSSMTVWPKDSPGGKMTKKNREITAINDDLVIHAS